MDKKKFPAKNALAAVLRNLKAEAQKNGRTLPEQISMYAGKRQKKTARLGQPESPIPPQILRQIIYATAEKAKLTPGQHLKSVLQPGVKGDAPKELQNWYAQIYGEFSKGGLSEVMREVLLYGANRDDRLMLSVRAAILSGDIRYPSGSKIQTGVIAIVIDKIASVRSKVIWVIKLAVINIIAANHILSVYSRYADGHYSIVIGEEGPVAWVDCGEGAVTVKITVQLPLRISIGAIRTTISTRTVRIIEACHIIAGDSCGSGFAFYAARWSIIKWGVISSVIDKTFVEGVTHAVVSRELRRAHDGITGNARNG